MCEIFFIHFKGGFMKKFLSWMFAFMLCLTATFALSGCKKDNKSGSVMTVSLNPEVEFVLDANNKVVSVNAINEEGNLIINGQAFVGMSDVEAVKLFINISKETGFLVTGSVNAGENEVNIAFSGDKAKEYYNNIQSQVNSYLTENNIEVTLKQAANLTDEYLNEQLEICMPYIEKAKIEAMSYKDKIEKLRQSRLETAEMYSQQLKDAYYTAKQNAVLKAKFDYVKQNVDVVTASLLDASLQAYTTACQEIENAKNTYFVNDDSVYQKSLTSFRQIKTEFLNYRNYIASLPEDQVSDEMKQTLTKIEANLTNAETALDQAYTSAINSLDAMSAQLTQSYNAVVNAIASMSSTVKNLLDDAENHINDKITAFETNFENTYATAIEQAKTQWIEMKADLVAGYQA